MRRISWRATLLPLVIVDSLVVSSQQDTIRNILGMDTDSQGRVVASASVTAFYCAPTRMLRFSKITVGQMGVPDVQVVLGTRGGIVVGDLQDEVIQHAVPNGKLIIRDARQHEAFDEVSANQIGHFQFTVPNKPVQILTTATGYMAASYGNRAELLLSEGEHRSLTIGPRK
jgi:hypothetical protein